MTDDEVTQHETSLRIDVAEAKGKFAAGAAVPLDVIQPDEWGRVRAAIPGAIRIPPLQIGHRYRELPKDCAIIAYCT